MPRSHQSALTNGQAKRELAPVTKATPTRANGAFSKVRDGYLAVSQGAPTDPNDESKTVNFCRIARVIRAVRMAGLGRLSQGNGCLCGKGLVCCR
jgi:hypothetical protein